ncbi:hypothetical protein A3K93_07215 [Acinetobacter sp. NCu2D-2]|uniref:PcfJ domain-containing protein n=1 Tax=Acinetobacter sp. NCu2D-2 TaxID=1608473 RepID=UPI0007CD9E7C|nr:PcfJ domain-containing protein [Acinetobacter sp. NCu2D-2]ANF82007.1 hypothetical protein A3K93_07215 [Acinetobacter sp. NCu2D-2]
MEQDHLVQQYQRLAKQMTRISQNLNAIYVDQMAIVGNLTAQNMFKILQEQHAVSLLDGLFELQFHTPRTMRKHAEQALVVFEVKQPSCYSEKLEEFFLQDLYFLTGDQKPQHSIFLREKAQHLRQMIIDEVYRWVNGKRRVQAFLEQLSYVQADILDHLLIKAGFYKKPLMINHVMHDEAIPESIIEILEDIFSLHYLAEDDFLSVQSLMQCLDDFCFSADEFLNPEIYRIMSLSFEERFNLQELNEHEDDVNLLFQHALERNNMLGFVRLMNRDYWKQDNLLAKKNFLEVSPTLWQKKVAKLPLFDCRRAVNWVFKQSPEVLDWLSANIQHSSVRVAVTAMSFVDTHHVHPQIILSTLQYFQYASARLFIHSAHHMAMQHGWFQHENNKQVVLKGTRQAVDDHRVAISPSILYLDEWMCLIRDVVKMDDAVLKKVYIGLSRVMQAYMQHLHKMTEHLSEDLLDFIRPQKQQNRDFFTVLQRYRIQLEDFRKVFYLQLGNVRESVFDSYVRDYLADYFSSHKDVPKSLTWNGLFHQAVEWHDMIQKQEIIAKLKKEFALARWKSLSHTPVVQYFNWNFEELKTIDDIIETSKRFRNCLAASYAQRIIEGEYAVFHMSHRDLAEPLLLGCYLRSHHLVFDQLEYPNNQKAEAEYCNIAIHFVNWFNQQLSQ